MEEKRDTTYQNITEILWSDELCGLLRLCGTEEKMLGEAASDYEKFRAIASAMPLLNGHPMQERVASLLASRFGIEVPLTLDNCETVWKLSAEALLTGEIPSAAVLSETKTAASDTKTLAIRRNVTLSSALSTLFLTRTAAKSFDTWMREIEGVLYDAAQNRYKRVFFGLPSAYTDRKPSIYQVDMTLHKGIKEKADYDLLYAQLMRCLSQFAQKYTRVLVLRIDCAPSEVISLLERVEKEVGLPPLIWTTLREDVREEMIKFSAKPHQNSVTAALLRRDYPTDATFSAAIADWATRYPVGRLMGIEG